jgi:hypothetical protein
VPIDKDRLGALSTGKSTYESWRDGHGIPVVGGFHIEDLRAVDLAPWDWKGGRGAFLDMEGTEDTNDSYLLELGAGGSSNPMKHLYEEFVYVLTGRGSTKIWQDGRPPVTFEWQSGSLFAIPLNARYQHFNGSGKETARMLSVTSAPLVINLYHNLDFVFECPFAFLDRFGGDSDYFSGEGRALQNRIWDTNFIADVNSLPLENWDARGEGSINRMIELADSSMAAHVSEFEVGKYKKAHKHGPGAHVIIIAGEGFSLMWPEGQEPMKFDWRVGSVIVPPDQWFHQHFNTGTTPAKYLALRWNSKKYKVFKQYAVDVDRDKGGSQIESDAEDPQIRILFEAELAKNGVVSQM